jgi:transcriptional regulator with XRE-family HTH domain
MPLTTVEKKYVKRLGANIVALRKDKGINQKRLSDLLDMDDGSLRRIESGRTNPTTTTLLKIAKALHIEMSELFIFETEIKT